MAEELKSDWSTQLKRCIKAFDQCTTAITANKELTAVQEGSTAATKELTAVQKQINLNYDKQLAAIAEGNKRFDDQVAETKKFFQDLKKTHAFLEEHKCSANSATANPEHSQMMDSLFEKMYVAGMLPIPKDG